MRSPVGCVLYRWLPALAALVLAATGCGLGQEGIGPPIDQIFLPGGLAVDPSGNWLYVINSNNDLRFNAGTLLALDLRKAKTDRETPSVAACSTTHFIDDTSPETLAGTLDQPCCVDLLRPHVLNCNERAYVQADATVRISSFGGPATIQTYQKPSGESVHRIFFVVRADPSVTFVDVTQTDASLNMRCTGLRDEEAPAEPNPLCDDHWRVRRPGGADLGDNVLPEEPHSLILDDGLGILYVSHLSISVRGKTEGGGVSTIDVAALKNPTAANVINSIARVPFPASATQSVVSMSLSDPGKFNGVLYAVSRSGPDIAGLVLQDSAALASCGDNGQPCESDDPTLRDLSLIPSEQIKSSVFLPSGTDVRGFLLSQDKQQAYVLHRNSPEFSSSSNPAALVVLDRRPGPNGEPTNQASAILEVCPGPTNMQFHDSGRGNLLYITCFEGGQINVVDPQDPRLVASIETGHGPLALTFSPADKTVAFVASYADNNVSVIDLEPGSPTEFMTIQRLGFPHVVTK